MQCSVVSFSTVAVTNVSPNPQVGATEDAAAMASAEMLSSVNAACTVALLFGSSVAKC